MANVRFGSKADIRDAARENRSHAQKIWAGFTGLGVSVIGELFLLPNGLPDVFAAL